MLHTTFALARQYFACQEGVDAMRVVLGPDWGDEQPIPLSRIALEGRGLVDAIWCLRAVLHGEETRRDHFARLLAADYAEYGLPDYEALFPDDGRVRHCIDVVRRFANGQASTRELVAARVDARAAQETAAWGVRRGTWPAQQAAARAVMAAAWAAVAPWTAAWCAAGAAGWSSMKHWHLETFLRYMEEG